MMHERYRFQNELSDLGLHELASPEYEETAVATDTVCIFLIDPSGVLGGRDELRKNMIAKLERKFNALDHSWLRTVKFKFVVIYRGQEPSDKEKAAFRKLDFPVYLLDKQHQEKTVINLMEKHRIAKMVKNTDIYKYARDAWSQEHNRGLGIPSGKGYRKVGFVKAHKILDQAKDWAQGFTNCIAHEIGHMGNITIHTSKGIMKYPVPMDVDITFADGDRNWFFGDLVRLKKLNLFRITHIKPTIFREF